MLCSEYFGVLTWNVAKRAAIAPALVTRERGSADLCR